MTEQQPTKATEKDIYCMANKNIKEIHTCSQQCMNLHGCQPEHGIIKLKSGEILKYSEI